MYCHNNKILVKKILVKKIIKKRVRFNPIVEIYSNKSKKYKSIKV